MEKEWRRKRRIEGGIKKYGKKNEKEKQELK